MLYLVVYFEAALHVIHHLKALSISGGWKNIRSFF